MFNLITIMKGDTTIPMGHKVFTVIIFNSRACTMEDNFIELFARESWRLQL